MLRRILPPAQDEPEDKRGAEDAAGQEDAEKCRGGRPAEVEGPARPVTGRNEQGGIFGIRVELAEAPVPISEDYLAKIVDEVVQNAFKFSSTGSPVQVRLVDGPAAVTLSVTDHGRGFSTEHITRVGAYMQFDRKLHEQQGLGLGLTIAKRLTELHGGTLAIDSERGAITTVNVRLPKEVEPVLELTEARA